MYFSNLRAKLRLVCNKIFIFSLFFLFLHYNMVFFPIGRIIFFALQGGLNP